MFENLLLKGGQENLGTELGGWGGGGVEKLLPTESVVLPGPERLLKTGQVVLEWPGRLLTTEPTLLKGM